MGVQGLELTENATTVLERRYLAKNAEGRVIETPEEMFRRVAKALAAADQLYTLNNDTAVVAEQFYELMISLDFLPNSPTLMNAGTSVGQLSACFVLPVEDSMDKIFDAVKATALIHQSGGGTGFSFSRLRPAGDIVGSTGGIASGPVSFMRVFDSATDVIKQGGRRRGANMGILRVDHPDILEFIGCKGKEGVFANFNISVAVTDAFMQALANDEDYDLVNPRTRQVEKRLAARDVFQRIVEGTWANGEPGVIFLDRMNAFNPTPQLGDYEATNPCGEQVLLPWESCNLGSVNLAHMVTPQGTVDWERLRNTVRLGVHLMDNVITINRWPLPQIGEATLKTRKIGLGVMGFADFLLALNVPYDSVEAETVASRVMEAISFWSKEASCELAMGRGAFPAYADSRWAEGWLPMPEPAGPEPAKGNGSLPCLTDRPPLEWRDLVKRIRKVGIRNATTTTIAPTGTISIIAGCSSGIEPLFALAYTRRHVLDADELPEINPAFAQVAKARGFFSADLMAQVAQRGSCKGIEEIPADVRAVFVTAHDVAPNWHVRMQAAFQRYTDNAVSKTINFPHDATREHVQQAFLLAASLGCKGLTMYRDGSREAQVLNVGVGNGAQAKEAPPAADAPARLTPRKRPMITHGSTEKIVLGCGRTLYVTINTDEVGLFEVFLQMGKAGGCTAAYSDALGRLVSVALRSGIETSAIVKQLKGLRCPSPSWHNGGSTLSCPDAVAKAIERFVSGDVVEHSSEAVDRALPDMCPECPDCGSMVEFVEGCAVCRNCGYSQCS